MTTTRRGFDALTLTLVLALSSAMAARDHSPYNHLLFGGGRGGDGPSSSMTTGLDDRRGENRVTLTARIDVLSQSLWDTSRAASSPPSPYEYIAVITSNGKQVPVSFGSPSREDGLPVVASGTTMRLSVDVPPTSLYHWVLGEEEEGGHEDVAGDRRGACEMDPAPLRAVSAHVVAVGGGGGEGDDDNDDGHEVQAKRYAMTSVTFLTSTCGKTSVTDVPSFRKMWTNTPQTLPSDLTLEKYYASCSFNRLGFSEADNIIVDLTRTPMPCNFTYNGLVVDGDNKCGSNEIYGWQWWVDNYATNVLKMNLTRFSRRIVMLPPKMAACPWAGLASVGCGAKCFVWLKNTVLNTAMHELGHTLGLLHANTPPNNEYGDASCAMGYCCNTRCMNAPHGFQLGWFDTALTVTNTTLPVGKTIGVALSTTLAGPQNHVRILPSTWISSSTSTAVKSSIYFLSVRQATGYDVTIPTAFIGKLSVHVFNGSQGAVGGGRTVLFRTLNAGETWDLPGSGVDLRVRYVVADRTMARVEVCRFSNSTESDCSDGLDNDCNGYIDAADPACAGRAPTPTCNRNGACEPRRGESRVSCPADCPAVCGDSLCETAAGENALTCTPDCPPRCGDCFCDIMRGENATTCAHDCPPVCGDGLCEYARGEGAQFCPTDCPVKCGDGFCDMRRARPGRPAWDTEFAGNCPADCPEVCGDYYCDYKRGESSITCAADCNVRCGDGVCDKSHGETVTNCPKDCLNPKPAPPPPPPRPPAPPPTPEWECERSD